MANKVGKKESQLQDSIINISKGAILISFSNFDEEAYIYTEARSTSHVRHNHNPHKKRANFLLQHL